MYGIHFALSIVTLACINGTALVIFTLIRIPITVISFYVTVWGCNLLLNDDFVIFVGQNKDIYLNLSNVLKVFLWLRIMSFATIIILVLIAVSCAFAVACKSLNVRSEASVTEDDYFEEHWEVVSFHSSEEERKTHAALVLEQMVDGSRPVEEKDESEICTICYCEFEKSSSK